MRNPTDLMRKILTSENAQRIIDFVSPIYGKSYVALWIYQAIGTVLDDACKISDQLRNETTPATADLLLPYWERRYGLPEGTDLTKDQRRARIISKRLSRGPCNPARLASAVSVALGGIPVDITENVGRNTFLVNIRGEVDSLAPAVAVLDRMKPAHLIYEIRILTPATTTTETKSAIVMTHAVKYELTVEQPGTGDMDVYVDGETLVINSAQVYVDGETLVLPAAAVDGETLIL